MKNKRHINHINFYAMIFFIVSVFLGGCADSKYMSEKLFWQAEQKANEIFENKAKKLEEKDYQEIIAAYRKVVDTYPLESISAKTQFIIANIYLSQGKQTEAQNEFRAIIQNFHSNRGIAARAQYHIGYIFESQGKWEEAFEEYDNIMVLYPLTPIGIKMPIQIVRHYQSKKDSEKEDKAYSRAVKHYEALLDKYEGTPYYPFIKENLAMVYLHKANEDKAIEIWDSIVSEYPQSPQAARTFLTKAELFSKSRERFPEAIEAYEEFIKRYPQDKRVSQVKLKQGSFYFQTNKIDKAKSIFLSFLEDYPEHEQRLNAYLGLSYCYTREKNTPKLMEIYEVIEKSYPGTRAALAVPLLTAQYYQKNNHIAEADEAFIEAISKYEALIKADKSDEALIREAVNFLSLCYMNKNDNDKAVGLLRDFSNKYPSDSTYLFGLAYVYSKIGNIEEAINVYKEILQKYSNQERLVKFASSKIKELETKTLK